MTSGIRLLPCPVRTWRRAEYLAVGADKVARISVTALSGDLFDGEVGFHQQPPGVVKAGDGQISAQRHAAV